MILDKLFSGVNEHRQSVLENIIRAADSPLFFSPVAITFLAFCIPNLRSFNRWQMGFWHRVVQHLQQKGNSLFCVSFEVLYFEFVFPLHYFCHHFALVIQYLK